MLRLDKDEPVKLYGPTPEQLEYVRTLGDRRRHAARVNRLRIAIGVFIYTAFVCVVPSFLGNWDINSENPGSAFYWTLLFLVIPCVVWALVRIYEWIMWG